MYAKVFSQIFDGTLTTKGPWEALVTFQQMLILADQEGCVDMTIDAICRRTTIPKEIIEKGMRELVLPDPESRTPAEEGRRLVPLAEGRPWGWRIVNYIHYRQLQREVERRDYHRQYWYKRKSQPVSISDSDSTNSTSTQQTQQTQPNQPIAKAYAKAVNKCTDKRCSASRSLIAEIPDALYEDFASLRKAKRSPITASAIEGIRREALKAGIDLETAIRTCCERGWSSFKADWMSSSQSQAGGPSKTSGGNGNPWAGAR